MKKTINQNPQQVNQPTNWGLVKKKEWQGTEKAVLMDKTYLFRTLLFPMKENKILIILWMFSAPT